MTDELGTAEPGFLTPRKRGTIVWGSVGVLAIAASASLAPHAGWFADVIADLSAQWLLLGLLLSVTLAALRKILPAAAALCVSAVFLFVLVPGRAPMADGTSAPAPDQSLLRVLHLNTNSLNERGSDVFKLILDINPDIVSLVEPPTDLVQQIRDSSEIANRYSPFYIVSGSRAGWPLLLTRWPQRGGPDWAPGPLWRTNPQGGEGYLMRVEHPDGPFFLLQTHASSPRSSGRWSTGNDLVARLAQRVRTELEPQNLPIILACDLNSTPAGWRSRRLVSDCSLRRCKPALKATGTFPAWLPWPLSIAIDDVFVSPQITVQSWNTVDIPGSDHLGVLVELRLAGSSSAP